MKCASAIFVLSMRDITSLLHIVILGCKEKNLTPAFFYVIIVEVILRWGVLWLKICIFPPCLMSTVNI